MATNSDVKAAFQAQRKAQSSHLVSTGDRLLSYGWYEMARWIEGRIVTRKGRYYSVTTAGKHRVYGEEAQTETPSAQAEMNL